MKSFVIPKSIKAPAPAPAPGGRTLAQLQADHKARLLRSGGRRVPFNLSAQALADIEAIKAREGFRTALEAVTLALRNEAKRNA